MSDRPASSSSASSRRPKRVGSLSTLADILPLLSDDLSLDRQVHQLAGLALWPRLVEPRLGPWAVLQTRALRIQTRGGRQVLVVRVEGAPLASELGFHLAALQADINRYAPQTGVVIDQIQLSVGALPKQN